MEFLTDVILSLVQSPWVYAAIFAVCVIDGFFPPIPSETIVIAAAAAGAATGDSAMLVGSVVAAAAGAIVGDNLAFMIGRRLGLDRGRWMRRDSARRAIEWAREGLARRATVLILTARYIPVGRVAVNVTAGATGLPHRSFVRLSALGGLSWAVYSVAIGLFAGSWPVGQPAARGAPRHRHRADDRTGHRADHGCPRRPSDSTRSQRRAPRRRRCGVGQRGEDRGRVVRATPAARETDVRDIRLLSSA